MDWLGANEERWRSVVRSFRAGIRRHVNTRLVPDVTAPAVDRSVRLRPEVLRGTIPWQSLLTNGWLLVVTPEVPDSPSRRLVLFVVSCGGQQMAYQVPHTRGLGFMVDIAGDLADILRPLHEVVHRSHQVADVQVYRLSMACCRSSGSWYAKPMQTTRVVKTPRKKAKYKHAEDDEEGSARMIMMIVSLFLHAAMIVGRPGRARP